MIVFIRIFLLTLKNYLYENFSKKLSFAQAKFLSLQMKKHFLIVRRNFALI